jgi:hypothetical protein
MPGTSITPRHWLDRDPDVTTAIVRTLGRDNRQHAVLQSCTQTCKAPINFPRGKCAHACLRTRYGSGAVLHAPEDSGLV